MKVEILCVSAVIGIVALVFFGRYFTFGINVSASLPGHLYLITKSVKPASGLVAFRWNRPQRFGKRTMLIKEIRGRVGDTVLTTQNNIYINGQFLCRAKPVSKNGTPLRPIASQVIGKGKLFVFADHPDSLDSRYDILGLIDESDVVGSAKELF